MKTTVYLAARYSRRKELLEYKKQLEAIQSPQYEVTSRWLLGLHECDARDVIEVNTKNRGEWAIEDYQDVVKSDICISFTEASDSKYGRGGRHVEFGIALDRGLVCLVVGPRENVFHCLPRVDQFDTWEECLEFLKRL